MAGFQSRQWVSWLLIGLPLVLLLAVALVILTAWTQDSRGQKPAKSHSQVPPGRPGADVEARLRDYVSTLSERVGERSAARRDGVRAAELFLESTFGRSNLGYEVRRREFEAGGQAWANLEMVLPGKSPAEGELVVGAHYDTAPGCPGADDNASGVAALLVLAERFAGKPQVRTVRWLAFCNEEPPWFQTPDMGSVRYAAQLKQEGVKVAAMISLESLGYYRDDPGSQKYPEPLAALYPDAGNFLGVVGNLESGKLVEFVYERLRETGLIPVEKGAFPESVPGVGWSDHWSFWKAGFPAVMLTDTAPYRNPHYHLASDRPETLDFPRMANAVKATEVLIGKLANDAGGAW